MIIASIPMGDLVQLVLFALGVTYVVTRSDIAFMLRWLWCRAMKWPYKKINYYIDPWSPVTCPPCNAWWSGAVLAWYADYDWIHVLQFAFTTCVVMALLQRALGGDIAPADDFESILGMKEKQDGSDKEAKEAN